ncbi:MAG TPA: class I SAM-dependent methyltransferase, partial [Bryobacteraceae bacterium]|nr:class I SAM-dependent methyltransferase [Bryobacteraceae bacterium]
SLASPDWMCFGVSMRSRFFDELLLGAASGLRTVVSLGAGLDTRPWRLDLPAGLRWIEVDFPGILDYKARTLAGEKPKCQVERIPADLNDPARRAAVFGAAGGPALMISEGVLMYLPAGTVAALAAETRAGYWILDYPSADLMRRAHQGGIRRIESVKAKDHLNGAEVLDVVRNHGWNLLRRKTYVPDAGQAAPERVAALLEGTGEPLADEASGVYLFARA